MLSLLVLPLAAAGVAFVFAAQLARQYRERRRGHALAWALSLALFGVASAAVGVGVALGWAPWLFAVYWVAGALLNVPMLAVGQMLLLDPRRSVLWWTLGGLAALWSVVFTVAARMDAAVLAAANAEQVIPRGREVLAGSVAYGLARPFSWTFVVVVVGSLVSAFRTRRWAVLLIALGVTVAAAASAFIRVGSGQPFVLSLAGGVLLMYLGFRAASAPRREAAA